ncbi:MAG: hypothetical protein ING75_05575 [Rhodocyclaceae bacterium]|nr:hypothetical protein [Rhodocyclaceae bacterium]
MDHFEKIKHTLCRMIPNDWQFVDDALIGQFRKNDGAFRIESFPAFNGLMHVRTFKITPTGEEVVAEHMFDPSNRPSTLNMLRSLLTRTGPAAWSTWTKQRLGVGTRLLVNFRSNDLSFLDVRTAATITRIDKFFAAGQSHDTLNEAKSAAIAELRKNDSTLRWLEGLVFPPPTNPFGASAKQQSAYF